jgi:hypothetical protein
VSARPEGVQPLCWHQARERAGFRTKLQQRRAILPPAILRLKRARALSGAQVTVKVPVHVRGPFNATGAGKWLSFGAFNDAKLATTGRVPITNIKLSVAKTGGGVSSLQVMYGKTWAPLRGVSRTGDVSPTFSPAFDGSKEYIAAAFAKPGTGILLDDVRFVTNTNRSIGGTFAKAAELQPLHPCPNWAPGRFRLAYVAGNAATTQQDKAKSSQHLFSLSLFWVDTTVPVPVSWPLPQCWLHAASACTCPPMHISSANIPLADQPALRSGCACCTRPAGPWSPSCWTPKSWPAPHHLRRPSGPRPHRPSGPRLRRPRRPSGPHPRRPSGPHPRRPRRPSGPRPRRP